MTDSRLSGCDTIVFDGEGVVIDSEPIWDKGQQEFLRRRCVAYERDRIKPLLTGRSLREGVELMQAQFGFGGNPDELAAERIDIVREIFHREAHFIPGFPEFFEKVRHQFKTCIATMMARELLDAVIAKLDLAALFGSHIYSPDVLGLPSKPAPVLFLYAARRLNATPAACMVIEDSPNGIEAARRAGMYATGPTTT